MCSQSIPFIGSSLQGSSFFSSGAFLGFKDTGMFCNTPFTMNEFFHQTMEADTNYACFADEYPFPYDSWDPNGKWYSPLCRGWYTEQKNKPGQNTMGDLYVFANGQIFGLTPCAPIVDYSTNEF